MSYRAKVTVCLDCPMLFFGDPDECAHPLTEGQAVRRKDRTEGGAHGTPEWCPLRRGPLTITLGDES